MKTSSIRISSVCAALVLTSGAIFSGCYLRHEIVAAGAGVQAVAQQTTLETNAGEFDVISIRTTVGEPTVATAKSKQMTVSATFLGESLRSIEFFLQKHLKRRIHGRNLELEFAPPPYSCERTARPDGTQSVLGVCVDALAIRLPEGGKTKVFVNGMRVDLASAHTLADALFGMKILNFGTDRLKVFEAFMATLRGRERFVSVAQARAILELLGFSANKLRAAQLLSGRVTDPENADQVSELFLFEDDQEQVVKLLKI